MEPKRMLVTAGSTATPIDKVRIVTNIFRGFTGDNIARYAACHGWQVTLLNSDTQPRWGDEYIKRLQFRTFDDLAELMEQEVRHGNYDAIVHSAAVSDYRPDGVYTLLPNDGGLVPLKADSPATAGKIPSTHAELFVRLVPTYKLIDQIREPWGFRGLLVKFKLQVDMDQDELLAIARRSLGQSQADFIVANCLEWSQKLAYILSRTGGTEMVERRDLAERLLEKLSGR